MEVFLFCFVLVFLATRRQCPLVNSCGCSISNLKICGPVVYAFSITSLLHEFFKRKNNVNFLKMF